jgi:hypothetical protein
VTEVRIEPVFSELTGPSMLCCDVVCWVPVAGIDCDCGYSEFRGRYLSVASVDLREFVFGASQADLEPFDLAEPALTFGFGDAAGQVVADLEQPLPLGGIRPK